MSEESQHDGSKKCPSLAASIEACQPEECPAETDTSPYSSHTNIPQMTASSALPESNKWKCELCTYENFPLSRKCTMCRTSKPSLGEDIFKLQDGASALPTEEVCVSEADVVAERLKPLRISSPQGQAGASSLVKWACATCTYENWPRAGRCAMCGAAPPAPAAPAPPAPAPPASSVRAPADCVVSDVGVGVGVGVGAKQGEAGESDEEQCGARRKRRTQPDWLWLQACMGVVEDDLRCVEAYLAAGGDPARALQAHELPLLDRASAFDAGHTLVHLAIRFRRQRILSALLARISGPPALKRAPSHVAPDLAAALRRRLAAALRAAPPPFACRYLDELPALALPAALRELPRAVRHTLLAELTDREAARALAADPAHAALAAPARARLLPLWNRSAGDCLPDALCQAAYGVSDRANSLRAALADTLRARAAAAALYARWAAHERRQAAALHYAPEEAQLRAEWARLVAAAARPGAALQQLHVFALAHVLRRPVLVYGADVVDSFRGEALGYACFRGVYLPLLWEPAFCSDSPLCLVYTRGHFSALVPLEARDGAAAGALPLADAAGKLLPVHFLSAAEAADAEGALRRWLRVCARGRVLAAAPRPAPRSLLQAQMLEEWLNYYRRLAQQTCGPFAPPPHADYSSDGDTDDE